jgi:hypothetical protein
MLLLSLLAPSCSKNDTIGNQNGKSGSITKFAVVGNYLYSLNSSNLDVYDIRVPETPVRVNSIAVAQVTETVFSYQGHLYIGAPDGVYIVDISVPDRPVVRGSETHWLGCDPVVVRDDIAYSTIRSGRQCQRAVAVNMLLVIDVSDPANPHTIRQLPLNYPGGLGYDGNTLFVCDGTDGVKVFDISLSGMPVPLSTITGIDAMDLITDNGTLIVSTPESFSFYDYSDRSNIVLKYQISRS